MRHFVISVLSALANICAAKCDHVAYTWQDQSLADCWLKAMTKIDVVADNQYIKAVS